MKHLRPYWYTVIGVMAFANIHAQIDTTSKTSPYDLISNYYQDEFKPFEKKSVYLGLAFALEDKSLDNTQRLLDKVVDGSSLEYNIEVKGGYFIGDYVMAGLTFEYRYENYFGTKTIM